MALSVANVVLTDTFDTWRVRTNEIINQASSLAAGDYVANGDTILLSSNTTFQGANNVVQQDLHINGNLQLTGLNTTSNNVTAAINEVNDNTLALAIALG